MTHPFAGPPKGIIQQRPSTGIVRPASSYHTRRIPPDDIALFVAHYWIVAWDLRGQEPQIAETLPHPSVHVIIREGESCIHGVAEGRFTTTLRDKAFVFGIKFKPGGFFPFLQKPVSSIANTKVALESIFGESGPAFEREILALDVYGQEEEMLSAADRFMRAHLPEKDENAMFVNTIAERIVDDRTMTKVEDVASAFGMNTRTLQRLFSRYVGVSPKWVIQRYRLHEALVQLDAGEVVDFTELALNLGYFDQAHFINDFKALVGVSPTEYAKRATNIER